MMRKINMNIGTWKQKNNTRRKFKKKMSKYNFLNKSINKLINPNKEIGYNTMPLIYRILFSHSFHSQFFLADIHSMKLTWH